MAFDFSEHPATIVRAPQMPADTPEVPAVIIGAGACGLTAALRLREAGIDCILLERDSIPQGSTALSSGFIPAAETRLQKEQRIEDSREIFVQDVTKKAKGQAAPHLVQAYTKGVIEAINAFERHGVEFEILPGPAYPGHSALRMHTTKQRTGAALMAAFERAIMATGADVLTNSIVRELWLDDKDAVIGVGYQDPDGAVSYVACDVLILACNGFGGNKPMVRELLPEMGEAEYGGHEGNDGSAIAWGKTLGAALADMGGYQGHGSWVTPQGALMTWLVMMEGGIQVNTQGKRFQNENYGYSEAASGVLAQPGRVAYNVFDAPILELARTFPDYVEAEKAGALKTAQTVVELATILGCDESALQATLDSMIPGAVDEFGREFKRRLQAPYYAVKVTGALFHTQGGLDVDSDCRVLKEDGQAFPNLLAAGGAARGVSGNEVFGYLSGNGLLSAVGGGWVAGTTAAQQLKD